MRFMRSSFVFRFGMLMILGAMVCPSAARANYLTFEPSAPVAGQPFTATVHAEGEASPGGDLSYAVGVNGPLFCEGQGAWSSSPAISGLVLAPGHYEMHACTRVHDAYDSTLDCRAQLTVWPEGGPPSFAITLPHDTTLASFLAHGTSATVTFARPVTATFAAASTARGSQMDGAPTVTGSFNNQRTGTLFISAPRVGSAAALHTRGVRLASDLSADPYYGVMYQPNVVGTQRAYTEAQPQTFAALLAPSPAGVPDNPVVRVATKLQVPLVCPQGTCVGIANASLSVLTHGGRGWKEVKLNPREFLLQEGERTTIRFTLPATVRRSVMQMIAKRKKAWLSVTTTAVNPITGRSRTSIRALLKLVR
jgi:hypothetical protein